MNLPIKQCCEKCNVNTASFSFKNGRIANENGCLNTDCPCHQPEAEKPKECLCGYPESHALDCPALQSEVEKDPECKHETTTEVCSECKAQWVWVNEGKMPPTNSIKQLIKEIKKELGKNECNGFAIDCPVCRGAMLIDLLEWFEDLIASDKQGQLKIAQGQEIESWDAEDA